MLGLALDTAVTAACNRRGLVLGAEMNADTGFDTPAYWNFISGGWSITGSKAVNSGATGEVNRTAFFDGAGKTYRWQFTISNRTAGSVHAFVGSVKVNGVDCSANGTYSGFILATSGSEFGVQTLDNFAGSVDDFSLKEAT